jgi:hypothetical protein
MSLLRGLRFFQLFIFGLLVNIPIYAQWKGRTTEKYTHAPLPFVHIVLNGNQQEYVSDIDGNFEIPNDVSTKTITFKSYLYRPVILFTDTLKSQPIEVSLSKYLLFEYDDCSPEPTASLLSNVFHNKRMNDIEFQKYYSYSTYNKVTLTPDKIDRTNSTLKKIFKFFSLNFNNFNDNQHLFMLESVNHKMVYSRTHHKEIINGAKSTIIDVPSVFIQTTQIQAISPYKNYINISNKTYIGPLARNLFTRYIFKTIDTIKTKEDTIYVVKYHPHFKKPFDGLKGLLYISSKKYAVVYFTASPAQEMKLEMNCYQSYQYMNEKEQWFPARTKTIYTVDQNGQYFIGTLDSYFYNIDLNYFSKIKDYNEVVLNYPPHANQQNEEFWNTNRTAPLSKTDSNTYQYYNSVDQRKFIQRSLGIGEDLYYGTFRYQMLNVDLKRILDVNQLEGLRLGFGAHTNEKFSDRFIIGGYVGYGFNDRVTKAGGDLTYKLRTLPIAFNTAASYDVEEAGTTNNFPFNTNQYTSETLRRIKLRIMDYVTKWENSIYAHPAKFLDAKLSLNLSSNVPSYDYQYKDQTSTKYNFTEVKAAFRYAYKEEFIQLLDRKILKGTKYPITYFQYTKGFNNFLGGNYNYSKFEIKIQYTLRLLDWGTSGLQVMGGIVHGDPPYSKLFNGNGSLRNFSVVIHNSFETMRYNEFLSDKYFAFFFSHNFGRIYYRSKFIKPSILLVHNFGYGTLKHPEYHKDILFKTMEKGYMESGITFDNLLVLGITKLKMGFGPGFFFRYGPYANPKFGDNFVIKLAVKFSL